MALNWKHIKGINGTGNNLLYTYIEFSLPDNTTGSFPTLSTSIGDTTEFLGQLLTTEGTQQTINKFLVFNKEYSVLNKINIIDSISNAGSYLVYNTDQKALQIQGKPNIILSTNGGSIYLNNTTVVKNSLEAQNGIILTGKLACGSSTEINKDYIQAPYFNATSDKRAKTNIQPFNANALDIINKLQTYTYNYINSESKSYGLMAQDLLDIDLNGFSFIDNKTATGENNDYMTIRESKLVYLLIEAVKEQQTQINILKQKMEELTNGK